MALPKAESWPEAIRDARKGVRIATISLLPSELINGQKTFAPRHFWASHFAIENGLAAISLVEACTLLQTNQTLLELIFFWHREAERRKGGATPVEQSIERERRLIISTLLGMEITQWWKENDRGPIFLGEYARVTLAKDQDTLRKLCEAERKKYEPQPRH